MKKTSRLKVPRQVEREILYRCAWTCCVCRTRHRLIIHHIDGNPSNSIFPNLAGLCPRCHDEAHTKHGLTVSLNPRRLKAAKVEWEAEVRETATEAILAQGSDETGFGNPLWTYFNHTRIDSFMDRFGGEWDRPLFRKLRSVRAIDGDGYPLRLSRTPADSGPRTIYSYLPHEFRHAVHKLQSLAITCLIQAMKPTDLDTIWCKSLVPALVKPGGFYYLNRAFYFKTLDRNKKTGIEERLGYAQYRNVRLEFRVSTWDMFGNSSVNDSFSGHKTAAALVMAKSVEEQAGKLVIRATPLAMGTGFPRTVLDSPYGRIESEGFQKFQCVDVSEFTEETDD